MRARDVAVATESPRGLSTQNILPATLENLEPANEAGVVFLRLMVGPTPLLARVTRDTPCYDLWFAPDRSVIDVLARHVG